MSRLEELKALIKKVPTVINFKQTEEKISEIISDIENDTSLLDIQKLPAITGGKRAIERMNSRFHNADELGEYLDSIQSEVDELDEQEIKNISAWFFRVAYSGNEMPSSMKEIFRQIVSKQQKDKKKNQRDLEKKYNWYKKFLEWDSDVQLSRNNLQGLLVSLDVLMLDNVFAQNMTKEVGHLLVSSYAPDKDFPIKVRIPQLVTEYGNIIKNNIKDKSHLSQNDSFVLHACIGNTLNYLEDKDIDNREELITSLKLMQTDFYKIRFRSSSVVYNELKSKLDFIEYELEESIDFRGLLESINCIKNEINISKKGIEGNNLIGWHHVKQISNDVNRVFRAVKNKHQNKEDLSNKIKEIELEIESLESVPATVNTKTIKRIQRYFKRDSLLQNWIDDCRKTEKVENEINKRIGVILSKCKSLWDVALKNEKEQVDKFYEECDLVIKTIAIENDYIDMQDYWNEIKELEQSIDGFHKDYKKKLINKARDVKEKFNEWINKKGRLKEYIETINQDIDRYHRRIYSFIDFENLDRQVKLSSWWANHHSFIDDKHQNINRIKTLLSEVKKLKWRQDKVRKERANKRYSELSNEINNVVNGAINNPGDPKSWESLIDIKQQINKNHLDSDKHKELMDILARGFDGVLQKRAEFAARSSIIYTNYNDELSNIMIKLESDVSKETALEGLELIKPIRARLRSETELLKAHRNEIFSLLSNVFQAINGLFEQASDKEFDNIKLIIEKIEDEIKNTSDYNKFYATVEEYKKLQRHINSVSISMKLKKEIRFKMENLWSGDQGISEKMRKFTKSSRFIGNNLKSSIKQLEQDNYLVFVNDIPHI